MDTIRFDGINDAFDKDAFDENAHDIMHDAMASIEETLYDTINFGMF